MTDSKGYSEFVALAGQGKAIFTVCRGASHFNFHFLKCFSYIPTRKWLQKIIFIGRLAHTFAAVSRWTTLSVRVEFWILFPLESKCILIHDSRHVQPYDQKTYLGWELHKFHVQSSLQVSVNWNLNISNVMCPLEVNVAVVADRSRLGRGSFHTACMFTISRLQ